MKFVFRKGFTHGDVAGVQKDVVSKMDTFLIKYFFDEDRVCFVDNLQKDIILDIKVSIKKKRLED